MIYSIEMILNCPSCSAKFMVSAAALGASGRDVRCGKCGHMWFVEPPRDSLDELQNLVDKIETEDLAAAEGFAPPEEAFKSEDSFETEKVIKLNASPKEILQGKAKVKPKVQKTVGEASDLQKAIAGFLVALAIFAVITWGILSITRAWYLPQASQLMLDQIKIDTKDKSAIGSFRVVNLSDKNIDTPDFKIFINDDKGRILSTHPVKAPAPFIEKESSVSVKFHIEDIPSVATKIIIHSE